MATVTARLATDEISWLSAAADVAESVRAAYEAKRALYPVGGGTALDYGGARLRSGEELPLGGFNRVVDYTPRDMTIVVEAGVRMAELAATLAAENQHLPIDVPRAGEATIGGVVATNWSGPRRYGHGTVRDYVIGIQAVDGRGVAFKGGGRVVKNVAGYDFCKLLTGSLGTLAVITQVALKVKPRPELSATLVGRCNNLSAVETALSRLIHLPAPPTAIDLLLGPAWNAAIGIRHPTPDTRHPAAALAVRLEGTEPEVASLADLVQKELRSGGVSDVQRLSPVDADALWARQVEFSDRGAGESPDDTPMVMKIGVPPSAAMAIIAQVLEFDPQCAVQSHAGNGIIYARFSQFQQADVTRVLVGKLRPAAVRAGGSLVVVSTKLDGLTPHLIWGGRSDATVLAERVKQQFDPHNILNPGRFVF